MDPEALELVMRGFGTYVSHSLLYPNNSSVSPMWPIIGLLFAKYGSIVINGATRDSLLEHLYTGYNSRLDKCFILPFPDKSIFAPWKDGAIDVP